MAGKYGLDKLAHMKLLAFFLLLSTAAFAQNPDTAKYAPRQILLVDPTPGTDPILPMLVTADGQQHLEFVPTAKIKEFLDKGALPVRLGDILSLLGANTQAINKLQYEKSQLQIENDKLWKVAMQSPSVVVQQQTPAGPSQAEIAVSEANERRQRALQMWMMLQGRQQPQPYQLPMPVNPNANTLQTNCTTYKLGDMVHTNCN